MAVELYPHQQKAVDEMHNGCILWGGVGTGKSRTALAYFVSKVCKGTYGDWESMRTPKDIYIITTAKKRDNLDWDMEAIKFGIGKERDASIGNIVLTVDSWNNIEKYVKTKDAFFIFDEQRLVGSGAWAQTFIKIAKHNEWVLLSATPGDTWLDYIPVFVANGWYKNRTEFKREHVVYNTYSKFPRVERYIGAGKLVRIRNSLLVHMPYDRHTVRHGKDVIVDYDEKLFEKVVKDRWHVYEERPLRDVGELFLVMRKVANSDPSRIQAVQQLLRRHKKLIVFYNFDYELEILRSLTVSTEFLPQKSTPIGPCSSTAQVAEKKCLSTNASDESTSTTASTTSGSKLAVAEWNGHKHQEIPDTDRWVYLVQYTAGSEGWNCIDTDAVCFYSLTYSFKQYHQAHGRIDRLNTPFTDLWYYTLLSHSMIDLAVWKSLMGKQSFNESSLSVK
jgi:hypothetical protein